MRYSIYIRQVSQSTVWHGPEKLSLTVSGPASARHASIEEGLKQKTRQTVVVLDWGSRSNAALGNFVVKV